MSGLTGLELPTSALESAAAAVREQVDAEVSGNGEIESVVAALEAQYDSFTEAQTERASLLAADEPLPSGDELGAELEKFLAEQSRGDVDGRENDGGDSGGPSSPN